jgi:gliding motility-associated-like protein
MQQLLQKNKNKLFLVLFTMFFGSTLFAQWNTTDWKFSTPKQFGFTALDVDFINNTNGILVGSEGGIAVTANGGVTWKYGAYTFPSFNGFTTRQSFSDIHYATATTAYAVGNAGLMVKSVDAGQTWSFVNTPFRPGLVGKNINAVWFLNKDTGYIGGTYLAVDSIPKLYVTKNGGATWDSIAAPISNGKSRAGYINNVSVPSILDDITAKAKEIYRIEFLNANLGYVCGSASSLFPRVSVSVNAPTATTSPCLPNTGSLTGSGSNAALLWKFQNGVLTDYSISKERLGYTGINTNTVLCNTSYNSAGVTPVGQTYRAMEILHDSSVVIMAFNNNCVIRVNTGVNDITPNINNSNAIEKGKYIPLNWTNPPTQGPNTSGPIPAVPVFGFSNPYDIKKAANGDLYANSNSGRLWASADSGKTWIEKGAYVAGQNYSGLGFWAFDILPNGKIITAGSGGVVNEFTQGGTAASSNVSNYVIENTAQSTDEIEFADCNNGMAAGGSSITVTENGAKTWVAKNRADFASSFTSITGLSYPAINKAYFATNNGTIYKSVDKGTTLDPSYQNTAFQMNDVQAIGNDTVYAIGYNQSATAALRKTSLFRSFNNGATWTTVDIMPAGPLAPSTTAPNLRKLSFGSSMVGYAVGNVNSIYKTTNAGTTWTRISPFPALNVSPVGFASASVNYSDVYAVNENIVFACGNMFTSVNNRRIYKSIDGGANWTDISGNLPTLVEVGNLNGILFHDANNGYVVLPGGVLIRTTNGGTSWTLHIAPSAVLTEHLAFAPRIAPPGVSMANRRLFVSGFGIQGPTPILEFGNPAQTQVSFTETTSMASCTTTNAGSITVTATGGLAPYMYSINAGAAQLSNVFNGLTTGNYTVRVMSQACDTATKIINVAFNNNLVLNKSNDTSVCAGAPVQLRASGNAATYSWTPATGLSATNIPNPVATVTTPTAYTVTATLNTCSLSRTITVGIIPNPFVTAGPDLTIVEGDDAVLQGSGLSNVTTIAWTPTTSIINGATTFTPTVKPATTTTYAITVRDNNSCTSTDNAVVTVIPYCVKVLEGFTPNGDGVNDRWQVTTSAACTNQIIVNVYNRYGSLVYNNQNYNNTWDGTYKGKAIPDGTYYFKLTYRLINGKTVLQQGNVTILR